MVDLTWSLDGACLLSVSTDQTARIITRAADGSWLEAARPQVKFMPLELVVMCFVMCQTSLQDQPSSQAELESCKHQMSTAFPSNTWSYEWQKHYHADQKCQHCVGWAPYGSHFLIMLLRSLQKCRCMGTTSAVCAASQRRKGRPPLGAGCTPAGRRRRSANPPRAAVATGRA